MLKIRDILFGCLLSIILVFSMKVIDALFKSDTDIWEVLIVVFLLFFTHMSAYHSEDMKK